jgi:serine/threonine protein phosphatase PrpC
MVVGCQEGRWRYFVVTMTGMKAWAKIRAKFRGRSGARVDGAAKIDIGAKTDVGRVREGNEDNFRVVPEIQLMIVSDGMGGAACGEVASELAVETIARECASAAATAPDPAAALARPELSARTNRLLDAVQSANRLIHESAQKDADKRGMGATVVAAWLEGLRLSLVHVGDSRAYLFRGGALQRLTFDHTLVAEQVRVGILTPQQADTSAWQSVLIRALGPDPVVELDAGEHQLQGGDVVLLCSDGLTRMVRDVEIAGVLADTSAAQETANQLVKLANQRGGEDNVTAVVMRIPSDYVVTKSG